MFDSAPIIPQTRPLLQSPAFFRALTAAGQRPRRLSDDTLLTTRRLPGGLRLYQIPRSGTDPLALPDLVAEAGLTRRGFVISPDRPTPQLRRIGAIRVARSPGAIELPLDGDLSAGLDGLWRHRLAHARDQEVTVKRSNLPMDPGHWIFGSNTPRRTRSQRLPASVLTLAYAAANPGDAKLFTAHIGQTRIAAMLFLLHDDGATWHMFRSTPHGHIRAAHYLLMWSAMTWLADNRYARLDLGPVTGPAPYTASFRMGTGALVRPLGDVWAWWPPLHRVSAPTRRMDPKNPEQSGPGLPSAP